MVESHMPASTSLENLHDIVVPGPVSWLPPAPGWYALGVTLLLLLIWGAVAWYRRRQRNAYRRQALAELARIEKALAEGGAAVHRLLPRLPALLKRTALAAYGRGEVASLCGKPWLDFLDRSIGKSLFSGENGRLLLACSYASATLLDGISRKQVRSLSRAVRAWLAGHRVIAANRAYATNGLKAKGST
ncbi:MAG: DUF4381 domain-containing protein [Deltaproteobacteria bacterium]|nr:DUF4381 domain-containing protein [Deltaproteobacteria bacterium]